MKDRYDAVIIGGSIAGISAALTLTNRGKSVAVISNSPETSSLYKSEMVTNYPGIPSATGKEISEILLKQLEDSGADLIRGRALNVVPLGDSFGISYGSEFVSADAVIVAAGITREKLYPGESEFLGRGVSYCATCDGMLYRGRTVAVIGGGEEAIHDGDFLEGIGCNVIRFTKNAAYEIKGDMKADTVVVNGEEHKVDGVFVLKDTVSVTKLVNGLEYADGAIVTDRQMNTNIPGIYAAGDCTGKPFQLAKAAGEGNVAALTACTYIDNKRKRELL